MLLIYVQIAQLQLVFNVFLGIIHLETTATNAPMLLHAQVAILQIRMSVLVVPQDISFLVQHVFHVLLVVINVMLKDAMFIKYQQA